MQDLGLLSQSDISLGINLYYQITDPAIQLMFLAYKDRNQITHSTSSYTELLKARFLPAALCMLIAPVYKYRSQIREALNGFIVSSFSSPKHLDMLSLINSERQKYLINFRGREDWLQQLIQKLSYIVLNGHEGMGKSALVAKITEELSVNAHAIGRNAGVVRKNAPWLPSVIVHFGKQSNQPHEIIDILLAQINTLLLESIDLDHGSFANKELPHFGYFDTEKLNLNVFETIGSKGGNTVEYPYTAITLKKLKSTRLSQSLMTLLFIEECYISLSSKL